MAVEAVIFDFGGVLIDWSPDYLYRKLIPDPAARARFLAEVCSPAWNYEQDKGRPFAAAIAERIARHPDLADLIRAYFDRWPEMLAGPVPGGPSLLERLDRAGIPLYGLTNWSAETFPHAQARFDFLRRFRHILVSGEVGIAKPDPRVFARMLEIIGQPAERCVFIDDHAPNLLAAERLGLRAIPFTDAAAAERALRVLGLEF
jgi:2-haloacid dehalogenase